MSSLAQDVVAPRRPASVLRRAAATLAAAATVCAAGAAFAETGADRRRLAAAMGSLVPYDIDGSTGEAMTELRELSDSLDSRVAATARYLRAAAAVELLTYAQLTADEALAERTAVFMRVPAADVRWAIERDLQRSCSARSPFIRDARASRAVLLCIGREDRETCGPTLRRIADSRAAGASAARMLLLERLIRAAEAARHEAPAGAATPLVAAAGPLCATTRDEALSAACAAAGGGDGEARARVAEAVLRQTAADASALRRAAAGGDPLASLASSWLEGAASRMGWLVMVRPLEPDSLPDVRLPAATAEPGVSPLSLIVIGRSAVTIGIAPTTIIGPRGTTRLDESAEYALPGRTVLDLPASFRAFVRPVPEVTAALSTMRTSLAEAIEAQGPGAPDWLEGEIGVLGMLVDQHVTLVDLARFVGSARQAGYERFAVFGAREDGRLAAIPCDMGSSREGPPSGAIPRLTVGPREVTLTPASGPAPRFQRRSELARLGAAALPHLAEGARIFAVQGRPMMPYGIVFPSIDAVAAAGQPETPRCLFLLPQ